jgi:hypothetical protein
MNSERPIARRIGIEAMPRLFLSLLCVGALLAFAGCDLTGGDEPPVRPTSPPDQSKDSLRGNRTNSDAKVVVVEPFKRNAATGPSDGSGVKPPSQSTTLKSPDSSGSGADSGSETSFFGNNDEARGFHAIAAEIADLLKLKKTLVVWLIDQSPGSAAIRGSAARQIAAGGQEAIKKSKAADGKSNPLSVAIVGFGKEVTILTPEPTEDLSQAASLVSGIAEEATDNPLTFTAVSKAVEQFLPYRAKGYQVIFVIAANQNGRDFDKLDEVLPKFHKAVVSVFGIGNAVPLGREPRMPADKIPSESFALERIDLAYPGKYSEAIELIDSGFGPFGLERLCRKTLGRFYRIGSNGMSPGWKMTADGSIDSELLKKHAPDYVSEKEYRELLSANKARQALVNAAKLPHADVLDAVRATRFTRPKNEAELATRVSNAQHDAAEKSLDVDRIYDALAPGEADRPKLTGARWPAEFDLAMGRILAAKSRIDGYNALLATIKQGKAFANKDSTTWILSRADGVSGSSVLNKNAAQARMYLNRVIEEHPGTPWAVMAEHELSQPVGWELSEE